MLIGDRVKTDEGKFGTVIKVFPKGGNVMLALEGGGGKLTLSASRCSKAPHPDERRAAPAAPATSDD